MLFRSLYTFLDLVRYHCNASKESDREATCSSLALAGIDVGGCCPGTLWEIGKADGNTSKYFLGPKDYRNYRQPGCFVIGRSDPRRDWPYVQPGPSDEWGPSEPQTFEVYFAVTRTSPGDCELQLDLADTGQYPARASACM